MTKTYGDFYSEDECLEIFNTTKYKLRKIIPDSWAVKIAGNGKVIYPAVNIQGFVIASTSNEQREEIEKRMRKVDVSRRERETFKVEDYVGIDEVLQYVPHSRQRVQQVVKSTTKHVRVQIFNQWFYYKPFWKQWTLNEGRINIVKSEELYLNLYNTFDDWLDAVKNW